MSFLRAESSFLAELKDAFDTPVSSCTMLFHQTLGNSNVTRQNMMKGRTEIDMMGHGVK